MGMYTELHFNSELRNELPIEVMDALLYMVGKSESKPGALPDHPLFSASRWEVMLRCDSYYFDADTHTTLRYDETAGSHYLCIRCNFKNYDDEIAKFVDWIRPYLDKEPGEFLGFYRYEEDNEPTLIYT